MPRKKFLMGFLVSIMLIVACESEKRYPPQGYLPNSPKATQQLEAAYFWVPQNKISSSYWKNANYVELSLTNLETGNLYADGYLNMTGTFDGLNDFNKGKNPQAKIKAGYDDEYVYILVEWKDTTANATFGTWHFDGRNDALKADDPSGWTSQGNSDHLSLLFDMNGSGTKDVWKWSLAYTAPFDMALNLSANSSGKIIETGIENAIRNASTSDSRIGPSYEWNGARQEYTTTDGSVKIIDPAYYLLEDNSMPYTGDVNAGQVVFNSTADCAFCHGQNGNGESDYGATPLNIPKINKYSREGLLEFISEDEHEGSGGQYWGKISSNATAQTDLLAFLRSIAGVPGYMLDPTLITSDISALCNISVGGIERNNTEYKVLFKRKLNADSNEDISFDPTGTYTFSLHLSDNDDINYIGITNLELIFKSNEL